MWCAHKPSLPLPGSMLWYRSAGTTYHRLVIPVLYSTDAHKCVCFFYCLCLCVFCLKYSYWYILYLLLIGCLCHCLPTFVCSRDGQSSMNSALQTCVQGQKPLIGFARKLVCLDFYLTVWKYWILCSFSILFYFCVCCSFTVQECKWCEHSNNIAL